LATGALLVLAVSLSGCGGGVPGQNGSDTPTPTPSVAEPSMPDDSLSPSETPTPTPTPVVFDDLSGFTVDGDFGGAVTVTADWPLKADQTMSEVLIAGDGEALTSTDWVEVAYTGINATTGQVFDASSDYGAPANFPVDQLITGVTNSLTGKHVGDRVLMAITGPDGYDSQGGNPQAGINVGDTIVFVMDILAAQLPGPEGDPVTPAAGLPTVTDSNGVPSVTIPPNAQAPGSLQVQTLIQGSGAAVTADDAITANYVEVNFADGSVLDSTFAADGTATPQTGMLDVMIPGWQQGLVGQTVGSRVLLVVPPALAYPNGDMNATPTMPAGQTLVYVVDILFTQTVSQQGS
jgi:peptidylprolyl isomerase